ncbi:histidine-containing phosphotransfer protein [Hordeum vulgare]|nr:histidine-containing phosphotransfer protein [Hordeum vulgare]
MDSRRWRSSFGVMVASMTEAPAQAGTSICSEDERVEDGDGDTWYGGRPVPAAAVAGGGGSVSGFVAEVSTLFIDDADRIIADIAALLDQPVVDFDKVDAHVHQLKGSSSSVGAQKVKLASMHFRQFYEAKSKEGCFMALALVRSEFCDVAASSTP